MPAAQSVLGESVNLPIPVSRLPRPLARCLQPFGRDVWLAGELRDVRWSRSHLFFTLVDDGVALQCVVWREKVARIQRLMRGSSDPEVGGEPPITAGDAVVILGSLSLDPTRVTLRCVVSEVRRQGRAPAQDARDRALEALKRDGLLDARRKRSLPRMPRAVVLITAKGSAAEQDVLAAARSRHPGVRVEVEHSPVQGPEASQSLALALRRAARMSECEVILLCRGGGSAAELAAFDDETLARAIAASPVPVVTGIGHETDTSLADLVADRRASTPSGAAVVTIPLRSELVAEVGRLRSGLEAALFNRLTRERSNVRRAGEAIGSRTAIRVQGARSTLAHLDRDLRESLPSRLISARAAIERSRASMRSQISHALASRRASQALLSGQLSALDPGAVLDRGYAIVSSQDGQVLSKVADFAAGTEFLLRLGDGEVRALVLVASDGVESGNFEPSNR